MIQKDTVPQTDQKNISLQNITKHNGLMWDFCPIIQIDKHMSYYRGVKADIFKFPDNLYSPKYLLDLTMCIHHTQDNNCQACYGREGLH